MFAVLRSHIEVDIDLEIVQFDNLLIEGRLVVAIDSLSLGDTLADTVVDTVLVIVVDSLCIEVFEDRDQRSRLGNDSQFVLQLIEVEHRKDCSYFVLE